MTQAGIVISQFFNGFAVRTDEQSVFKVGLFSNMPLVLAEFFGLGIISAISYLGPLQSVFHTAPLTGYDWLMLATFGLVLLIADELRKAYVRSRRDPQAAAERTAQIPLLQHREA
jgi:magnesium-transporting ATPase (P-type)